MRKGNIILLVLVVIAVVVASVGGYFWWTVSQKPDIVPVVETLPRDKAVESVCSNESFGYKVGDYYECQNFNVLYPGKNVMDAPIIITDKNWKEINSCGGMPGPNGPNECPKQYSWDKCVKKSCN